MGRKPTARQGSLRPYIRYKPSSDQWTGDVPAHWEVRQLGRIDRLSKRSGGTKDDDSDEGVPCIRYGDLIVRYLDFTEAKIRRYVNTTQRLVGVLKERQPAVVPEFHTRLIADVVTGKIDVRDAAAKLPDADPAGRADLVDATREAMP